MKKTGLESVLLLTVLSLIWGSSFILMKKGLIVYSPSIVASLRIVFASLFFIPIVIKNFKKLPWSKIKYILMFALFEIGFPPYLYTYAQIHVDSSTAGILNSLVPLFTLLVGAVMFKLKFHWLTTLGVMVGLVGAFILTFIKNGGTAGNVLDITNAWGLLIVLATLFYGLGGNILKQHLSDVPGTIITGISFVVLSIPTGIFLLFSDVTTVPLNNHTIKALFEILLLASFGSALALVLFNRLIQRSSALFASFVTYFIPFVSLVWGWLDGENISIIHFSSLLFIFLGIYISNLGEGKKMNGKIEKR